MNTYIRRIIPNRVLFKREMSFDSWFIAEQQQQYYSTNKDDNDFYVWIEKILVPFPITHNCFRAKNLREILYEALNTPDNDKSHAAGFWTEEYLSTYFDNIPIQQASEAKKLVKTRVKIMNKIGKNQMMEHYKNGQQQLFLTNRE